MLSQYKSRLPYRCGRARSTLDRTVLLNPWLQSPPIDGSKRRQPGGGLSPVAGRPATRVITNRTSSKKKSLVSVAEYSTTYFNRGNKYYYSLTMNAGIIFHQAFQVAGQGRVGIHNLTLQFCLKKKSFVTKATHR